MPVLGVSVDPANDTPRSARAFLAEQHMTGPDASSCSAREAELEPLWKAFGIAPQTDGREHSAGIVLASGDAPAGRLQARLPRGRTRSRPTCVGSALSG